MRSIAIENPKEMPALLREINAIITIMFREIINGIKTPERIFMALLWPLMFMGVMGGGIAQNLGVNMRYNFSEFMMVGMSINSLLMMTMHGIASLVEDRENDFTQEIFVTPVSRFSIIVGKTAGASFAAYIQFFATIIVGFIMGVSVTGGKLLTLLLVSPIMCLIAGSIGVMCVGFIKKSSTMGFVTMMTSMLQMFLGGAMFPINHSTGIIKIISHLMPLTYCLDFTRGIFYSGKPEYSQLVMYPPELNLLLISFFAATCFITGTIFFVRSEKNR